MPTEIKKEIQLEIAHVLFIDIVGYSKLSINEQRAAIDELNEVVRGSEQFQKAEAAARLIKIPTGDGMALVFYTSPEAPTQCAIEIGGVLNEHPRLQLRMGVHSGPVSGVIDVNGHPNLAGAGLNLAQRVMNCGDAGHILVSKRVADDLGEYEHWRPLLHDLGACEVKHGMRVSIVNLYADQAGNPELPKKFQVLKKHRARVRWVAMTAGLLALVAIVAGVATFSRYRVGSTLAAPEKSIAVLPFENRSEEKANTYFTDGIQDEILTRLSKIADLKVISRTSTERYKSAPENVPEIARQLGVAHILEGSVQKSGDAVRVNVQLIKASNDSHLWADTFDRKLTDIFSVESEVAKAVAEQLRAKLTGQEEQLIAAKPTDNVEAYDAFLRGLTYTRSAWADFAKAQEYLKEAVRLDPKFALGWAMLSHVDADLYVNFPIVALGEEARQAAETALTLQPNLGEALLAKGHYHYECLKDYATAVRYFEQARQFLPNSGLIPESLAFIARKRGQWDLSESYFNEAERLDPANINLLIRHAASYMALRRFPEALRKLDQALDITPDDGYLIVFKANIAQAEGDLPKAAALLAPRRANAFDAALLAKVNQAMLERRPERIIPRLKELLAKSDPALAPKCRFCDARMRFWLGQLQEVAGDHAAAQESWRQTRSELEPLLKEQPENLNFISDLSQTNAGLGDKAAALALAERALALVPIEKDAINGPLPIELLARVAVQVGEPDRAIVALQKLLSIPGGLTPALLRLDPMFDPLRSDLRFQKLCEDKQQ